MCGHVAARGNPFCNAYILRLPLFGCETLVQISLQHLPTMQAGGASGEAPLSGPNKMLSGLFAKAHTQATGLLAKVSRVNRSDSDHPTEAAILAVDIVLCAV